MKVEIKNIKAITTAPNIKSTDKEWLAWVKFLAGRYGDDAARTAFIRLWTKVGSSNANTYELRSTLKSKYNIEIDETVWNKIVDLGGGIASATGKIFKAGKITVMIGAGIVFLVVVMTVVNAVKTGTSPIKLRR